MASPVEIAADSLVAQVQIAHLVNGHIPTPINTTHLIYEIGCSDMFTVDEEQ